MALSLRQGRVTAVVERLPELVRCEVDDTPCVAYPRLTGPVEEGDEVIVNIQARDLELGSSGFDLLHVNLTRGLDLLAEPGAHVMKLPYTSLSTPCRMQRRPRSWSRARRHAGRLLLVAQPGRSCLRGHRRGDPHRLPPAAGRSAARFPLRLSAR